MEDETAAKQRIDRIDQMRRDTEALIGQSTELLKKIRVRLEELGQLRLAREALLKEREENKRK